MLAILQNRDYALLFTAQVVALIGAGLLAVALGLLAYDIAGDRAGLVLGTVFTIKMVAYVGLSPLTQAAAHRLPRKAVLIGADLVRGAVALCLPFVSEVWQVYALVFVLQAASATFTPAYQAILPDILPREADYTRALSLSRLTYDLENLLSPALAALLLLVVSYSALFTGTTLGFLGSALCVLAARIPSLGEAPRRSFLDRATRGIRLYLATPRLRGFLALTLAAAAPGAFVLVNTVVLARAEFGRGDTGLAIAMAAFGAGSMLAALLLPRVLEARGDRAVMLPATAALSVTALVAGAVLWGGALQWGALLAFWAVTGALYSAVLTPAGRLIRRSSGQPDRPALFAAQFALSHACWLITYPLMGWAGLALGMGGALALSGGIAAAALILALRLWPDGD